MQYQMDSNNDSTLEMSPGELQGPSLRQVREQALDTARKKSYRAVAVVSLIIAMLLCGIGYQIAATWHNNKLLVESTRMYEDQFVTMSPEQRNEILESAWDYNDNLSAHPFTPPPIGYDDTHERHGEYLAQLAGVDDQMAVLTIPDHDISLPVFHGTSTEILNKGVGHLFGTHLPVGARPEVTPEQGVTTALSAHTGMYNKSMFDNLQYMQDGELAYLQVAGEKLVYRKVSEKIVPPDARDAIDVIPGADLLQLITCTPYGINTNRLVVTLERVMFPEDTMIPEVSTGATDNISGFTLGLLVAAVLLVLLWLLMVAWEARLRRRAYRNINACYGV